jgi:hypothetical protein
MTHPSSCTVVWMLPRPYSASTFLVNRRPTTIWLSRPGAVKGVGTAMDVARARVTFYVRPPWSRALRRSPACHYDRLVWKPWLAGSACLPGGDVAGDG